MELETDIIRIRELAQQREDVNWAFRCFLKSTRLTLSIIDSKVQELYQEVSRQIDCTQCGNCCRFVQPILQLADVKRLAKHQGMSVDEFRSRYLQADGEGEGDVFRFLPCPFLTENRCTVYDRRPTDCRSFPHLHKREFVFRLNQAFANCSVCPIVFNVYEGLKREFWRHKPRD
jgi:Fe-S-cluster containining protein